MLERIKAIWHEIESRKIGRAAVFSLVSKILAAIIQIVAIPIAVAAVGERLFGAFLVLSSIAFWISSTSIGIGNTLTTELAAGRAEHGSPVPVVGLVLGIFQAVLVSLICYVVISTSLSSILGTNDAALLQEAQTAAVVLVIACGMQLAIQPLQGMQFGALEGSVQFAFQAIANFFVILGLVSITLIAHPTLTLLCIMTSVIPLIVGLANVTLFAIHHREKFTLPSWSEFIQTSKHLYRNGFAFLFVNLSTYAILYGPTVFLAWMTHGKKFIAFSIYNRIIFFLIYAVWLIALPLWPALVKARIDGDERWVRRAVRTCFLLFASLASFLFLIIGLFGRQLIDLWTGLKLEQSSLFAIVFAAYYVLVIWREFLITILISFERVPEVSAVQLLQTILAYGIALILVPRFGELGMALAMTLGIAFTSGWLLPLLRVHSPSGAKHSVANLFLVNRYGISPTNPKRRH